MLFGKATYPVVVASDPSGTEDRPWWQGAVVYQIYPRSFADSGGDGIGDLEGIRRHLDHLSWLGVDAIWLSPFYRSPMDDFGYDISDHCDVDPLFGTLEDFDRLVTDCHERHIRVIVDWVPNHTSDRHPWFEAARSSRDDPHRDWYVWRDPTPDGAPPNNWVASFSHAAPAWTFDEATGQWYLHLFLPSQPDVNWDHPGLEAAMHDVLRFWLDRGVDGIRADVLHAIGKEPALPDDGAEFIPIPHSALNHVPEVTLPRLRSLRALLDSYPGDRMMVGEVALLDTPMVAEYYDDGRGIHLSFNFPPMFAPWDAGVWRARLAEVQELIEPVGWPSWVLSNHDNRRHRSRYGGSEARARAAAFLVLGLRGTPFLYAGEELGLSDAVVPEDRVVDPGGRDGCRAPIPWTTAPDHGWGVDDPWLPWPPEASTGGDVASQRDDPSSVLHLYRRILSARRASPALTVGRQRVLDTPDGVLAWERTDGEDLRIVVVGFTGEVAPLDLGDLVVEVASDGVGEGVAFTGSVGPDRAVVLRPA